MCVVFTCGVVQVCVACTLVYVHAVCMWCAHMYVSVTCVCMVYMCVNLLPTKPENSTLLYKNSNKIECIYWRASVASETLTGVTQLKIGCLFIYIYGRMYVILYFDPHVFVLVMWSTPSQIALNRILWFIDQYPYHPRN